MKHTANSNNNPFSNGFGYAEKAWFDEGEGLASEPGYVVYEPRPGQLRRLSRVSVRVGTMAASLLAVAWLVV